MLFVLYGGFGCGVENIWEFVWLGINKINVGFDFMKV